MENETVGISIRLTEGDLSMARKAADIRGVSISMFAQQAIEELLETNLEHLVSDLEPGKDRLASKISESCRESMKKQALKLNIRQNQWAVLAVKEMTNRVLGLTGSLSDVVGLDMFFNKESLMKCGLEYRRGQHALSRAIFSHLKNGEIGISEAGTGTGKAYACLSAAEAFAIEYKIPVIVATYTRALQKQLFETSKLMAKVSGRHLSIAVVYGKQNYVSITRIEEMFEDSDTSKENKEIIQKWMKKTKTWLIADLSEELSQDFPVEILAIPPDCSDEGDLKPYKDAMEKASESDVIITSHHMLFYAMMQKKGQIFGFKPDHIVIDEAHLFNKAVDSILSKQISLSSLSWGINKLLKLEGNHRKSYVEWNQNLVALSKLISGTRKKEPDSDLIKLLSADEVHPVLSSSRNLINCLSKRPKSIAKKITLSNLEIASVVAVNQAVELFSSIDEKLNGKTIYRDFNLYATLSPVLNKVRLLSTSNSFIAKDIERIVWNKVRSASLLSATILLPTKGGGDSAQFFINSVGLKDKDVNVEPVFFEPWVYDNLTIYVSDESSPCPVSDEHGLLEDRKKWIDGICRKVEEIDQNPFDEKHGGVLILCTSYSDALDVSKAINLKNRALVTYEKGDDMRSVLNEYKSHKGKAVLIGLGGFWTGVDLPGSLLTDLVITRLPILASSDRLILSRFEYVKKTMNFAVAFSAITLPNMAVTLRQGVGRVIRKKDDVGRVYILDPRVVTKPKWRVLNILRRYEPILVIKGKASE